MLGAFLDRSRKNMIDFLKKHVKAVVIVAAVVVCAIIVLTVCLCVKNCGGSSGTNTPAEQTNIKDLTVNTDGMTEEGGCFKLYMDIGEVYTLSATSQYAITYSSTSPEVAEVNKSGEIAAKEPGSAVIYVNAGTQVKSIVVEVQNVIVPYVAVVKNDVTLSLGIVGANVYSLVPSVTFDGKAVECELSYSSTQSSVASVNDKGVITALSVGECHIIITANYSGITATCAVKVAVVNG